MISRAVDLSADYTSHRTARKKTRRHPGSARTSCDRGGCPLLPRGRWSLPGPGRFPDRHSRFQRQSYTSNLRSCVSVKVMRSHVAPRATLRAPTTAAKQHASSDRRCRRRVKSHEPGEAKPGRDRQRCCAQLRAGRTRRYRTPAPRGRRGRRGARMRHRHPRPNAPSPPDSTARWCAISRELHGYGTRTPALVKR